MSINIKKLTELHKATVYFAIDLAESSMNRRNFRTFKKLMFDQYHQIIEPQLYRELEARETHRSGQCQSMIGEAGVPMIARTYRE